MNVVLTQTVKNKETTEYYTGVNSLKSILEDLNEDADGKNTYEFYAVIEDGRATSVIIVDGNKDNDYEGPDGSTGKYTAEVNYAENRVYVYGSETLVPTAEQSNAIFQIMKETLEKEGYSYVKWGGTEGSSAWKMTVTNSNGASVEFQAYYVQK